MGITEIVPKTPLHLLLPVQTSEHLSFWTLPGFCETPPWEPPKETRSASDDTVGRVGVGVALREINTLEKEVPSVEQVFGLVEGLSTRVVLGGD